jgi:hypothetical protein
MKNKDQKKHIWLSLTGGLGNQLFQLAAASSLGPDKITLVTRFGLPRTTEGIPDVSHYKLPPHIELENAIKEPIFFRKTVGYLLRMGITPRVIEKNKFVRLIINFVAHLLLSFRMKHFLQTHVSQGVGFFPIKTTRKKVFLIGYYQSKRYLGVNNVEIMFQSLELKSKPEILLTYETLATDENPLVVHVRLGDYRLENNFGILTQYYYESIHPLWSNGTYKKIWLFSDEPSAAIEVIPTSLRQQVRVINDSNENPATTLELMRLGKGYVIANSSLSWWGAKLSRTENPIVVAPTPWFKSMPEPQQLIPKGWQRRAGFD